LIVILAIENHKDDLYSQLCERYSQRITGPFKLTTELLSSARVKSHQQQREKESETILKALKPDDIVFICDENGRFPNTQEFAKILQSELNTARGRIVFCIGGAYGFTDKILSKFKVIGLSKLTMPHQLARLVLIEQIYRAYEISKGSGYHHT
jgi:23S rRNA (pseudouridine1915-N3)-methyltransferase